MVAGLAGTRLTPWEATAEPALDPLAMVSGARGVSKN
jgi:hypothetical protein